MTTSQPQNQPTPESMETANQVQTMDWVPLPSTTSNLTDQNGKVLATVKLLPKFYPPLYHWSLTVLDAKGRPIHDNEFGEEEAKQAALTALAVLAAKQEKRNS